MPLAPANDPIVSMMQVEEKPDVTYADIGGCKQEIIKLREVLEAPLLAVSLQFCVLNRLIFEIHINFLNFLILARTFCTIGY